MAAVNGSSICTTPACQSLSAQLLQSLAPNYTKINACENWDQLVCGGYRQRNQVPANQRQSSVFSKLSEGVNIILRDILSSKDPKIYAQNVDEAKTEAENVVLVKTYYESCKDDLKSQKNDGSSLIKLYETIFELNKTDNLSLSAESLHTSREETRGMDPVVEQALMRMSMRDLNTFVSFGPAKSLLNPNQTIVAITPELTLGMPPKYYHNKELKKAGRYQSLVEDFISHVAPESLKRRPGFNAGFIMWYESRLSLMLPITEEYKNLQAPGKVMQVPIHKLKDYFTYMPMQKLLEAHPVPSGYNMSMVELILPEVLLDIDKLLGSTTADTKLAYMFWKVFIQTQSLWNAPWLQDWKKFVRENEGREAELSDEMTCLNRVKRHFPDILDLLYVQQHFPKTVKTVAKEILGHVKRAYIGMLNSTTWLSTAAHSAMLSKAANIVDQVGFKGQNPNILDPILLKKHYDGASFTNSEGDYADYFFHMQKWHLKKAWEKLGKPLQAKPWYILASTVNALYSLQDNSVTLPAAILQSPIFDTSLPSVANYAAFGSIAGHELTHALDDQGRNFGADGVLGTHGWGKDDVKSYTSRAKCFKRVYEGAKGGPSHENIKGGLVLGEAIADSYGAEVAYRAWKENQGPHNEGLTGLEMFTPDQLFWILRSTPFCSVEEQSLSEERAQSDAHAPMNMRTWVPLKNSKEWHKSFGCEMKEPVCDLFGV